jgi:hypothetical protein
VRFARERKEMHAVFLVGEPEGKTSLGMYRRIPYNNIKIYLKDIK